MELILQVQEFFPLAPGIASGSKLGSTQGTKHGRVWNYGFNLKRYRISCCKGGCFKRYVAFHKTRF